MSIPLYFPKPTPEFLAELLERAKRYGWDGDYGEISDFVEKLFKEAGIDISASELEPYEQIFDETGNHVIEYLRHEDLRPI